MKRTPMYEVWASVGSNSVPGPRFRLLADAIRYVEAQTNSASLAIRNPDGTWHTPPPDEREPDGASLRWPTPARVLVVDDDRGSREALAELLRDEGYTVDTAADGIQALGHITDQPPDLVITDVMMPHTNGFDLVQRMRERAALLDLPIILISALDDISRRVKGLELGADDYLGKPLDPDELLARVRVHLRHARRSRELVARSAIDELTGVLNRGGILGVLERERERSRRQRTTLAVFVIDVDDFKSVNDRFGHSAGDEVLRRIAGDLVRAVRANDRVGRFGGDEFLIVAPDTGAAAVDVLTRRINQTPNGPIALGEGISLPVSLSVGCAIDDGHLGTEELFNRADEAMYRHKRRRSSGRPNGNDHSNHAAHH